MIVDYPIVVQHQVPTIQTVQKSGEVSQCQHVDRYRRARKEAETGPDQPENPEDGREDTRPSAQRHVPIIQKFQKIAETPQIAQRECRSSRRTRRLLRHHRNSCGRCRGSSSSRRRLSTQQVLVIQSPEDRVRPPTGTGHGHDRRFPLVLQHQVQRQRSFLRASSLFVEDLPEMGQRQDHTEKIQKTVAKTEGQIAQTFSDRPEVQKTVKLPQQTQRGQSPEGQTRPSEVRAQRAREDTEGAGLPS